jgi:hypothetical protein
MEPIENDSNINILLSVSQEIHSEHERDNDEVTPSFHPRLNKQEEEEDKCLRSSSVAEE